MFCFYFDQLQKPPDGSGAAKPPPCVESSLLRPETSMSAEERTNERTVCRCPASVLTGVSHADKRTSTNYIKTHTHTHSVLSLVFSLPSISFPLPSGLENSPSGWTQPRCFTSPRETRKILIRKTRFVIWTKHKIIFLISLGFISTGRRRETNRCHCLIFFLLLLNFFSWLFPPQPPALLPTYSGALFFYFSPFLFPG